MTKILLIEDNPEMRENIEEILELSNYNVISAENGKIGVELAKRQLPDLILCDVMMPELDGYGTLYMLSKDPKTAGIPFIFLTAKAEKTDVRKGMNLGADDYLTKPFEEMELLGAIDMRLQRNKAFKLDYSGEEGLQDFIEAAKGISELNDLSNDRKSRTYKKKEAIFREGDYANNLYYLKKGKIKSIKTDSYGKELVTDLYNAGNFLGYMPLLGDGEHAETAVALEDSEVVIIPKDDFVSLIRTSRDVATKFIKMLANNVVEKEERLLKLAYGSVRERVADALLQLQARYREEGQEAFSIRISREDLASIVGTATESLIRSLSEFKADGLVETTGREIRILDEDALKRLSSY